MAAQRAQAKLAALMRDLEVDDGAGSVPAIAAEADDAEASSVTLGLSDVTPTDTAGSGSDTGHAANPVTNAQRRGPPRRAVGGSSGAKRHIAELENKVLELLLERKAVEARHTRELVTRDEELARAQHYIETELADLAARQAAVEQAAPPIRAQLAEARAALRDLSLSDARYQQLKRVPQDSLPLADAVRVAVHEATAALTAECEQQRLSAAAAREAAHRAESEAARISRENARLAAAVADAEAAVESSVSGLQARNARLTGELEELALGLEVARAKADMYDELAAKTDLLEADVSRMTGVDGAAAGLRAQLMVAQANQADRDATLGLLTADKAHLTRQLQVAEERLSDTSSRLAAAEAKVSALKAERTELHKKLAAASDTCRVQEDDRWERQLAQLQAAAAADLERIRREAADAAEREGRLLRDLRDAALDEAAEAKGELRRLRTAHEELLVCSREAAARASVEHSELLGELKLKGFELSRLQVLCEERGTAVSRLTQQVEVLQEKVRLLSAELSQHDRDAHELAADLRAQLQDTQAQLREFHAADGLLDRAVLSGSAAAAAAAATRLPDQLVALLPGGSSGDAGGGGANAAADDDAAGDDALQSLSQHAQLSGALQRRIQHNIRLAARCGKLESEKRQLERERAEAMVKLAEAEAGAASLRGQLQMASQPHAFLLTQLQEATEALRQRDAAATEAAAERSALRRDLERVLRERGALDAMRRLVAGAVAQKREQR